MQRCAHVIQTTFRSTIYLWGVCSFDHRCGRGRTASERSRRSSTTTDKQWIYRTSLLQRLRRPPTRIAFVKNAATERISQTATSQPRQQNDVDGCNNSLTGSITTPYGGATIYQLRAGSATLPSCCPSVRLSASDFYSFPCLSLGRVPCGEDGRQQSSLMTTTTTTMSHSPARHASIARRRNVGVVTNAVSRAGACDVCRLRCCNSGTHPSSRHR